MPGEADQDVVPDAKVDLPIDAHLPHTYVPGERLRLSAYRQLAAASDETALEAAREELVDRYGPLPTPVENLLAVARFRIAATRHGLTEVSVQGTQIRFAPMPLRESQVLRLQRLYPRSVVKQSIDTVLVPKPMTQRLGGQPLRDTALLQWCSELLEAVLDPVAVPA